MSTEPTHWCSRCHQRKPWSQFYARKRWDDGTMRAPQNMCKDCTKEYRDEWRSRNPERVRAQVRRAHRNRRDDPERLAIVQDLQRERMRRVRGTPSERYRSNAREVAIRGEAIIDPQPFLHWLRTLGPDAEHIGAECGIDPAQIRKYLSGAMVPTERTVDRAVTFAEQTHRLNDLLPLADTGE